MKTGDGILFLPSLNHSNIIEISNIDLAEGEDFIKAHNDKIIIDGFKRIVPIIDCRTGDQVLDRLTVDLSNVHRGLTRYLDNIERFSVGCPMLLVTVLNEIKKLMSVNVGGVKGKRGVYLDDSVLVVGSIIYGNSKCYFNYVDPKIEGKLNAIQTLIDNYTYQDTI